MNYSLKLALLASGKPAYRIASSAGLSESTLSRIVRGRRPATDQELKRIAKALSVPVSSLNGGDDPPWSVNDDEAKESRL